MGMILETQSDDTMPSDQHLPLDVHRVGTANLPWKNVSRLRGTRWHHMQAIFKREVIDEIHAHGKTNTAVEICGVLVGNVYQDSAGPYLHVESCIRGNASQSKGTEVTFTAETWTQIDAEMERHHPDKKIVGWYHTHPGFGIFLSGMDHFIQEHFFNFAWQVAFVYDPLAGTEGVFAWHEGKSERDSFLIEEKPGTPLTDNESDLPLPPRRWPLWVAAGIAFAIGFGAMIFVSQTHLHL